MGVVCVDRSTGVEMTKFGERRISFALFALLALTLLLAGCKGESPTAPITNPPGTGNPTTPGGGITPPTSASIVLTVSNATPLINSTSVVTAVVTQGGANVPDGTAVEFETTLGTFDETSSRTALRTTTNGRATATLSSPSPGEAIVRAFVGSSTATTTVTFSSEPDVQPPPDVTPTIGSITPTTGVPAGGQEMTINGTNFKAPVRVIFDFGGGRTRDAAVLSVTSTQIRVLTPSIDLGTTQTATANIIVISDAGSPAEFRLTGPVFTFQPDILTPSIVAISPASGPINGGTRVTVFGEGFQSPVQLFFGSAEAQVLNVTFSQIIAMSPTARDTSPNGSATTTGPVSVRVINIKSATEATLANGFRYTPKMAITAVGPTIGPSLGGTDVLIDGIGFDQPVTVSIGGIPAQPIRVSGTQILAQTGRTASPCSGGSGPVIVTNVNNGDTATSTTSFTFIPVPPVIASVSPAAGLLPGGTASIVVTNPGIGPLGTANIRFTIAGQSVIPSPSVITDGVGNTTFSVAVPTTGFTFPTEACTTSPASGSRPGIRLGPTFVTVAFTNSTTGCTDTVTNALRINPPDPNLCLAPPLPSVTTPAGGACATPADASVTAALGFPRSSQASIVVANAPESQPLNITNVAMSGTDANQFTVVPTSAIGIAGGGNQTFTLTFTPTSPGPKTATATFTTNSPTNPTLTVCVTATAAP